MWLGARRRLAPSRGIDPEAVAAVARIGAVKAQPTTPGHKCDALEAPPGARAFHERPVDHRRRVRVAVALQLLPRGHLPGRVGRDGL